jgi:hypothetical protein
VSKLFLLAIPIIVMCGCDCRPQLKGHTEASYVRDPSHHCKFSDRFEGAKYVQSDGTIKRSMSWNTYECDNSVNVIVDDEGEQP